VLHRPGAAAGETLARRLSAQGHTLRISACDIDKSADARAGYEKHGRGGIPLIFIGKDHVRGFNSQWVETRLDPSRRR